MTAATTPQSAFGTTVSWAGHDIGYLKDIDGPNVTREVIAFGTHESIWKTKLAGMADGGQVTFDVALIPGDTTGQKYFWADLKAGTEQQVIITYPDETTYTFNALATGFKPAAPVDGELVASFTMEVSGVVTFSEE